MTSILASNASAGGGIGIVGLLIEIVVFGVLIYFLFIKPQKKEQERQTALQNSVEAGDSILTTSGFYGNVIGVEGDVIIVEFGNNKHCRIPMKKTAVLEVEKAKKE